MPIFSSWFTTRKEGDDDARLWLLTEKSNQRRVVLDQFCEIVRSHYNDLDQIADDIKALGYKGAAKILKEQLPTTATAQSGELGEIMATEFVEERLGFQVPVRRLRYKDGREMALRGDDFIGVDYDRDTSEVVLLKGESKSSVSLTRSVIEDARTALDKNHGRCTPVSLIFVAGRLLEGTKRQKKLGRILRNEVSRKAMKPKNIHHALFTLTGNNPETMLIEDLGGADEKRKQNVINIRVEDHQSFIHATYKKAAKLGRN